MGSIFVTGSFESISYLLVYFQRETESLKVACTMFIIADDHQKNFSKSALLICGRSRGDMRTTFSLRHGMASNYEMPSHFQKKEHSREHFLTRQKGVNLLPVGLAASSRRPVVVHTKRFVEKPKTAE